MKKLQCPRCQSENIKTDDVFDISSTPFDIIEHICAHCLNCGANIMYSRIYQFAEFEDIGLLED